MGQTLIVNGQHLTIVGVAPAGFEGTTLGARPHVYVPITMRGLMQPGFSQWDNRRTTGVSVGPVKPASLSGKHRPINVPYRAILKDVEAPRKALSDKTMSSLGETDSDRRGFARSSSGR